MRKHCILFLAFMVFAAFSASAQSQSQAQPPPASQTAAQPQASTPKPAVPPVAASSPQSSSEATSQPPDPIAEAARKAKAKKAKLDSGKVLTEDDLSKLDSRSVSVVGQPKSANADPGDYGYSEVQSQKAATSGNNEEGYWRSRAQDLLGQIDAVNQEIAKVQDEIKKYGSVGFDPSTGLSRNVIYVDDRNAHLKKLQNQKAALEQKMDALQEEGRKAGAPPSWFR